MDAGTRHLLQRRILCNGGYRVAYFAAAALFFMLAIMPVRRAYSKMPPASITGAASPSGFRLNTSPAQPPAAANAHKN